MAATNFHMAVPQLTFGALLVCVFEILFPNATQARPRDEVMSRAFRCAVIGDSRSWLDCYYGAAQPARAALGLQPVPSGQLNLVLAPPVGNPTPNDVTTRDQVFSNAIHCNEFTDERQWLDCYYAAAQPMRTNLGLSAGPQAVVKSASNPANSTAFTKSAPPQETNLASGPLGTTQRAYAANFGLQVKSEPALDRSPDHIDAYMASYTLDQFGIFTVTLANGQVWRQLAGDTNNAHWNKPAKSYAVRISHGFLGSYNLKVKDNPGEFKVRRVR
jgi:hypothetical protein